MNGYEFLKKLNKYAKARDLIVSFDAQRGKGSHGEVSIDGRHTTLKDRKKEIGTGLLRSMLKDLGVDPNDF